MNFFCGTLDFCTVIVYTSYMENKVAITVRLPERLYKMIESEAEKERRSFNSQLIVFLETIINTLRKI